MKSFQKILAASAIALFTALPLGSPSLFADEPAAPVTPGAPPPAAPAVGPAGTQPGESLTATILDVAGKVAVSTDDGATWKPAAIGMVLPAGAEFRTGPRSAVSFRVPPDQVITLDRLGTIKLLDAIQPDNQKVKTDIGMKYGRTDYRVEGAGVEHDVTIHSPAATLAVRGTDHFWFQNTGWYSPQGGSINTPFNLNGIRAGNQGVTVVLNLTDKSGQEHDKKNTAGKNQYDQSATQSQLVLDLPSLNGYQLGDLNSQFGAYVTNSQAVSAYLAAIANPTEPGHEGGGGGSTVGPSIDARFFLLDSESFGDTVGISYNGTFLGNFTLTPSGEIRTLTNLQAINNITAENINPNDEGVGDIAHLGVELLGTGFTHDMTIVGRGNLRTLFFGINGGEVSGPPQNFETHARPR